MFPKSGFSNFRGIAFKLFTILYLVVKLTAMQIALAHRHENEFYELEEQLISLYGDKK